MILLHISSVVKAASISSSVTILSYMDHWPALGTCPPTWLPATRSTPVGQAPLALLFLVQVAARRPSSGDTCACQFEESLLICRPHREGQVTVRPRTTTESPSLVIGDDHR